MRSKPATIRTLPADPVYNHPLVTRLINGILISGKKTIAQKQVYHMMAQVKAASGSDPLSQLLLAVENVSPQMEVRARRIGGAAYQVPAPVRPGRRSSLAMRWLIAAARSRPNAQYHTFAEKLAAEILDAAANSGTAVKKKLDTHRMAEANKAFAHFRW